MWLQAHLGLAGPRRRLPGRYLLPLLMSCAPACVCVDPSQLTIFGQRAYIHGQHYNTPSSKKNTILVLFSKNQIILNLIKIYKKY